MMIYESLDVKIMANESDEILARHMIPELRIYREGKYDFEEMCIGCDKYDLAFTLLRDFAYLHENKNRYLIAGAAFGKGNKGIILTGGEGIGKSTITYLMYKEGFEYIGDDALLLEKDEIIGGNDIMKFDRNLDIEIDEIKEGGFFKPNKIRKKFKIYSIVIPSLNKKGISELKREDAIILLYNEITKIIRAVNFVKHNFLHPIESLDNEVLATKRLQYVNDLVDEIEVYSIGGSSIEIKDKIIELFF